MKIYICIVCGHYLRTNFPPKICSVCRSFNSFKARRDILRAEKKMELMMRLCK